MASDDEQEVLPRAPVKNNNTNSTLMTYKIVQVKKIK